ncbi:hypothetical protein LMH87_011086 [Akanthomyces muscarius]|uniref:Uncharacterized protein n=1 Tax=Akanthomyces muscarius TaxID=2231603 RepID=A0A9W8UKE7_AKAMU|nr:hypothetical protein LMH87_011086 [Akanthomyces muscarius]KAJ4150334.1 hypothetical protein LMH87_011086 [Akanthomyces muscarius]
MDSPGICLGDILLKLTSNGVITKERRSEEQWVTTQHLHAIIRMMLADGIENGTYNSDVLILKALFLLLQVNREGHEQLLAASIHTAFRRGHFLHQLQSLRIKRPTAPAQ